jgi:uncharacterized iron-regulated membrane protein
MVRRFFVWLHRWVGLAIALQMVIVGLTGSMLAFRAEIDTWLNPDLLTVPRRAAPLLDGLTLRDRAAALHPGLEISSAPLEIKPDRSVMFMVVPDTNQYMASEMEIYLDPYTGRELGARHAWSGPSFDRKNIISFLYRVHFDLALPWNTGELGDIILGVTALAWTIDCFVALGLTLPRFRRAKSPAARGAKSWLSRWAPAWMIKLHASAFRINFDFHRALGLWTWLMLFVLAWSSVALNLSQVFTPVMHEVFAYAPPGPSLPQLAKPLNHPRLGWREAYTTGHALLQAQARDHGFSVDKETSLSFDSGTGAYTIGGKAAGKGENEDDLSVTFGGDTGALLQASWPGSQPEKTGDVVTNWLIWLHTAAVWGLPLKVVIFIMGLVITGLSGTGVYIWWKKRSARVKSRGKRRRTYPDAPASGASKATAP